MARSTVIATVTAVALAGALATTSTSLGAQTATPQSVTTPQPHQHDHQAAQSSSQDMSAIHEKMMADMQAANARLEELLATVKTAKGDARVDALASLVTELVQQRQAMHQQMMQGGMTCPMMQGMEGMPATAGMHQGMNMMQRGGSSCGMKRAQPEQN